MGDVICPAYKSSLQLQKETSRLMNGQKNAEHKKTKEAKYQEEYERLKVDFTLNDMPKQIKRVSGMRRS